MKTLSALVLALSLAAPALAKEAGGVTLPDTATVEGKTLKLKGMGVRTKFVFKVYVAGLYVEDPALGADALLASDSLRQVHLVMTRDLEKAKIAEAISDGFAKNNKAQLPKLQERLTKFTNALIDAKSGDHLIFTYVPGKGLVTSGKVDLTIEGKDFADALFSVWLGKDPVDGSLKEAMLGGK